jgi:hypothetical protein
MLIRTCMMFSLVRIFSGQVFAPADKPATAYIRASSTIKPLLHNRCGRPQRGARERATRPAGTTIRRHWRWH